MERKPEQISRDIAAFERKLSEAGDNQVLKEALTKRIKKLKDELKGGSQSTKQLAYTLLGARKKVKELAAKDFRALMLRLSKKSEYDFLKRYSAAKAKDDMERKAKPVGYRFKGRGNYDTPTKREIAKGLANKTVYSERRPRRSDVSQVIQLAKGGGVGDKKYMVFVRNEENGDSEEFEISAENRHMASIIALEKTEFYRPQIIGVELITEEMARGGGVLSRYKIIFKNDKGEKESMNTEAYSKSEAMKIGKFFEKQTDYQFYRGKFKAVEAIEIEAMATGGGLEKYPELRKIADEIADETAEKINKRVEKINSKMPYKAQWVLEEVVRDLENRI